MSKIVVKGGKRLLGDIKVSGAKNSALKIMAAALLTDKPVILRNVPDIADVRIMINVLRELGVEVETVGGGDIHITSTKTLKSKAPYHLVNQMRASVIALGPLLARLGEAQFAMPGGCNIGSRKIDLHIRGLELMGAEINVRHGYIEAKADRLRGADIHLAFPSVGATENLMMAAVLAKGKTWIRNAAKEPEIVDLAKCLIEMGAKVSGAGTETISIDGVTELHGVDYTVMPDRIETGTYMVAGAITDGEIFLKGACSDHLKIVVSKLRQIGIEINCYPDGIEVKSKGKILSTNVSTLPYAGFPTDLQAPFMALLSLAKGTSVITENVFESRFVYVNELRSLGGKIDIESHHAIVHGSRSLVGAKVKAPDLRGGAALVIAGLASEGSTEISDVFHIDRGYDSIVEKLSFLGADIHRTKSETNLQFINFNQAPRANISTAQ